MNGRCERDLGSRDLGQDSINAEKKELIKFAAYFIAAAIISIGGAHLMAGKEMVGTGIVVSATGFNGLIVGGIYFLHQIAGKR